MVDNNKMNSFWEGVKTGAGCTVGTVGFILGDIVGVAASFKHGVGVEQELEKLSQFEYKA